MRGEGTEADARRLGEYLRGASRPSWIPPTLSFDVAAALSQITRPPTQWARVELTPRPDGEPWTMTVHYTRGYPQTIEIPGGGGPGSGAREVLDLLHHPESFDVRQWAGWNPDDADVGASP